MTKTLSGVLLVHGQPVNLEDGLVSRQLDDHVLVPVDTEWCQVTKLIRNYEPLAAGLRTLASKEDDLSTTTIIGEGWYLDCLGVHHHHWLGADTEPVPVYLSQSLVTWRLEAFSDVDITKVSLSVEIKHGEPLEITNLLQTRQFQYEVLIEISSQHIGSSILVRNNVSFTAWLIAAACPEEGVLTIAIINKVVQEQSFIINSVHITRYLTILQQ